MEKSGDKLFLREFTINDYEEYCEWWKPDNPPELSSLPNIGYVSGDMKAVGFLANTDTDFMIFTFWHANPENTPRESYKALIDIIESCKSSAKRMKKNYIFCYTNERGMIRLLESQDFINYDGHLIAKVK